MLRETRLKLVLGVLLVFGLALIGRSAYVQLWQGAKWEARAARQHYARSTLAPPRGDIQDMSGISLAQSQVKLQLAIIPPEVTESRRLMQALQRAGVDNATLRRAADRRRKWVPVARTFLPTDIAAVRSMRGVWSQEIGQREYVPSSGLRKIVGRTDANGAGIDGIEMTLDSLLRGERGTAVPLVGPHGQRYESREMLTQPPRPGHTVVLTVSYVLQDICDRALSDATLRLEASGGDIVVLDPRTGEVRCLSSQRTGAIATASTALTEPFEPGSTLKPFYTGYLLDTRKARVDEVVETFNGSYRTHGRTITDVHKAVRLSLADVVRYSSNVGIVRFTERLTPREMYEILRDFGFGSPTGVLYPSEAAGLVREPRRWSAQSQASLAIGYELSVTPLQLASAYAAIANGGRLYVPSLVKEIRDADGNALYVHQPQLVRQVLQPATAKALRRILASVVDSGTATDASLTTYEFGGKSGTARRATHGRYGAGSYTSTFVGLFPADEPQYVVLVKLDNPRGTYYGGKAAAPVAKAVVEAAIAARDAALDRSGLSLKRARYVPPQLQSAGELATRPVPAQAAAAHAGTVASQRGEGTDSAPGYALVDSTPEAPPNPPVRFDLGKAPPEAGRERGDVVVPDVRRLPLRVAVRELHRAGLRVTVVPGSSEMWPAPGSSVSQGSLVRLGWR
jgi:cell division protein FtsI (penicillin-binding protein 3)